jgi:hypothetical protein
LYERFEQTIFDTAFETKVIEKCLYETGFKRVRFVKINSPHESLNDPEKIDEENAVFVVSEKI